MGEDQPFVVPLGRWITQFQLDERFLADKTWDNQSGLEFVSLAHAGLAFVTALRVPDTVQLNGDLKFGESRLGDGYAAFLPLGGYMFDGEYRDETELVIIPPHSRFYPEVFPDTFALLASPGPSDSEITDSRTSLSLPSIGLSIGLHPSILSAAHAGEEHVLENRTFDDGTLFCVKAYQIDRRTPHAHTHRCGGELMLIMAGEVRDGRQTLTAGHLCVNGPRTSHAPTAMSPVVVLTVALGKVDSYEPPALSDLKHRTKKG